MGLIKNFMIVFNKIFFRKGKMRREVKQIVEILSVCIEFRGSYLFIYLFIFPVTRINDIDLCSYFFTIHCLLFNEYCKAYTLLI